MVAMKRAQGKKKSKSRARNAQKRSPAETVRFEKLRAKIGRVKSTCGKTRNLKVPRKLVPLIGIFVNFGTCSVEVTINGGVPISVLIPSQAGWVNREILLHPLPTDIKIECMPTVAGGDCDVGYVLIW